MGRSEKEQLKKRLLDTRAQMLHQGKIGMRRAMSGKAAGDFDGVRDEGDVSSYEQSEMLHYAVLGSMREIIRQIEEALERLAGGVYGICLECDDEIDVSRLRVVPYALHCRDCQAELEAREKRKN